MAKVIITARIMPQSPQVDTNKLQAEVVTQIKNLVGESDMRIKQEPIAFGLVAVIITFIWDEKLGSPEDTLAPKLAVIEGFNSFEMTDVRRAIG